MAEAFQQLCEEYFQQSLQTAPEEATILGLDSSHLSNPSEAGHAAQAATAEEYLMRLELVEKKALQRSEQLDYALIERRCRYLRHLYQHTNERYQNLNRGTLPHAVVQFQWAHLQETKELDGLLHRLEAVPNYLESLVGILREGLEKGKAPYRGIVEAVLKHELPGILKAYQSPAIATLERLDGVSVQQKRQLVQLQEQVAKTYQNYGRFLEEELLPGASGQYAIGAEDYQKRIRLAYAIDTDWQQLVAEARNRLDARSAQLVELAGEVVALPEYQKHSVDSPERLSALVTEVQSKKPLSPQAVIELYQGHLRHAEVFVRQSGSFALPDNFSLNLQIDLPGLPNAANWPAPLLKAKGEGIWALNSQPQGHSLAWSADLAIHEGIPGHYLQSAVWQDSYHQAKAPLRFFSVADFLAASNSYWGSNMATEGWAVYAEQWMLEQGFFGPEEALCVGVSHLIREARVVVDASLHCGRMGKDEAVKYLQDNAYLSPGQAQQEVLRYSWIPTQAACYALGRQGIEDLKEAVKTDQKDSFSEARFHQRLLQQGPIAPHLLSVLDLTKPD